MSSQMFSTPTRSFPSSAALNRFRRVTVTDGVLAYAGVDAYGLGTLEVTTTTDDEVGSVRLWGAQGTRQMVAAGAIAQYAVVFAAASGKVNDVGALPVGIALQAAGADGDIIEVLPLVLSPGSIVVAKTADYTVTTDDNGKTFTTVGASGTVTFALPAAVVGMKFRFRVGAAQQLRIDPNGTEVISLPSTGVPAAAGKYLVADADGETVDIECTKAGQWSVFGYTGTWTAEA